MVSTFYLYFRSKFVFSNPNLWNSRKRPTFSIGCKTKGNSELNPVFSCAEIALSERHYAQIASKLSQIAPKLHLGAQPSAAQLNFWAQLHIQIVLRVRFAQLQLHPNCNRMRSQIALSWQLRSVVLNCPERNCDNWEQFELNWSAIRVQYWHALYAKI